MKKFTQVLAMALACVVAVSMTACNGSGTGGGDYVSLNPTTVNFDGNGGTEYVAVSSNTTWTVTSNAGWVTAVKENNTVKVTVGTATATRTGTVTVNAGTASTVLNVNQTVTASATLTADDLVGTWTSTGYWYDSDNGYSVDTYDVSMTKVNATTVTATNALGLGTGNDVITITVNTDGTITIPSQAMNMYGGTYGWPIYFNRVPRSIFSDTTPPGSFADNWGEGWYNISVPNKNTIDLSAGGFEWSAFSSAIGTPAYISIIGFAEDVNNDAGNGAGTIYFFGWMTVNTVWTKTSSTPAPLQALGVSTKNINTTMVGVAM